MYNLNEMRELEAMTYKLWQEIFTMKGNAHYNEEMHRTQRQAEETARSILIKINDINNELADETLYNMYATDHREVNV